MATSKETTADILRMAGDGLGWEDIIVSLIKPGLASPRDGRAIRNFVLAQSRVRHTS